MSRTRGTPAKAAPNDEEPAATSTRDVLSAAAPWLSNPLPPAPVPGTITADLASDTDDPVLLKQRLTRARERLGFYESFDRIIQENIRRSGELMLEAITFREHAQAQESEANESRAALDQRVAERDEQQARILNDLLTDIERSRATLATLSDRVQSALYELHGVPIEAPAAEPTPEPLPVPAVAAPIQAVSPPLDAVTEVEPTAAPEVALEPDVPEVSTAEIERTTEQTSAPEPRTVEVLVHGVPRAAVALSLQRHLGTVADILTVEAREFAEGVLRLQVTSLRALAEPDLEGWQDGDNPTILRADPTVLEITLLGADDANPALAARE